MDGGRIACREALRSRLVDQGFEVIRALTGRALGFTKNSHDWPH
jgi:hypothetical protein